MLIQPNLLSFVGLVHGAHAIAMLIVHLTDFVVLLLLEQVSLLALKLALLTLLSGERDSAASRPRRCRGVGRG